MREARRMVTDEETYSAGDYFLALRDLLDAYDALAAVVAMLSADVEPDEVVRIGDHPKSCWCGGTGWRSDMGVPCNLPQRTGR